MEAVINKTAITEVITSVTVLQRSESAVNHEKLVNSFLDSILALREFLNNKSETLESIEQRMVEITFIDRDELNNEDYTSLRELIEVAKSAYSSLMRFYAQIRVIREKGGIKKEALRFKEAASLFKETADDIDLAFFQLPATNGYQEAHNRLAQLIG